MKFVPSAQQLEAFNALPDGPLVLFYEFGCADRQNTAAGLAALRALARQHGGELRWAASEEDVLIGRIAHYAQAARLHFPSRAAARACVEGHGAALQKASSLQVAVLGEQPRALSVVTALMAKVLPRWPFDDTLEDSEEPGIDVSTTMPTSKTVAALRGHADQTSPVVMINWLKFKPGDGKAAYYRYGKVAMTTTHSIGAKLLFAARYRIVLVGNGGDPATQLWDEFALMQYPGRAAFGRMAQLRRYRKGLADREAGLAEYGQGLTLSKPDEEFVWRP